MARMVRMLISIPAEQKTWLEAESRRRQISVSELIRIAIRGFQEEVEQEERRTAFAQIAEKHAACKGSGSTTLNSTDIESLIDRKGLWQRAVAAAGRFASGLPDLSIEHDRYAWGEPGDAGDTGNKTDKASGTQGGSGAGRGARSGRRERQGGKGRAR